MSLKLTLDGIVHDVTIIRRKPHLVLLIDGREHEITQVPEHGDGRRAITVDGQAAGFSRAHAGDRHHLRVGGRTFDVGVVDPFSRDGAGGAGQDAIKAPMPGAVVQLHRQTGEAVTRGETLVTIESMKLQTALASPRDGVVAQILRGEGESFDKDAILVTLAPETGKA